MRILVVEDDDGLREGLVQLLEAAGWEVEAAADGEAGVEAGQARPFDLALLDRMLPGIDGLETCRRLRLVRPGLPVVILTALGSETSVVDGLSAGADDYVVKPFGARELLARLEAVLRRTRAADPAPEVLRHGALHLDLGRLVARRDDEEVALTAREAGILRWLWRHRQRAVSRAELLERVWGTSPDVRTRTVDVTIGKLRRKIEADPSEPAVVVTVPGVGYAWGPE